MSWFDDQYNILLDQLKSQTAKIQTIPELKDADDAILLEKFKKLTEYLDHRRLNYAENVEFEFNQDGSQCLIITDTGELTTEDPETLEYLSDIENNKKKITPYDMKTLGYDDDWMLDELPLSPDHRMKAAGVGGKAANLALLAFYHNKKAMDFMINVRRAKFNLFASNSPPLAANYSQS